MTQQALFAPPVYDVQPGDIYALGRHRLMCADATDKAEVSRLFAGTQPLIVVTSPPYEKLRDYHNKIECWDSLMIDVFGELDCRDDAQVLINLGVIHRQASMVMYWQTWVMQMQSKGWLLAGMYPWDKLQAIPGANLGAPRPAHEFVFHFRKRGLAINDTEPNKDAGKVNWGYKYRDADGTLRVKNKKRIKAAKPIDSVLRIRAAKNNRTGHPAVYPVALPQTLISAWKKDSCVVYDPFIGSGTTIHAAEAEGVIGLGCEISPAYVTIALARWNKAHPDTPAHKIASAP